MTIGYEPVFGDQSLFDNAPEDAEMASSDLSRNKVFYKIKDSAIFWCRGNSAYATLNNPNPQNNILAMRRIIKTPTWTWEDKKAGRLPEVGCNVSSDAYGYVCSVVAIDSNSRHVWCQFPDQSVGSCMIFEINPIETPAEKAKREEDEFVTSLCKELDGTSLQHDSIYEIGVRAAYRKLKVPTND